MKKIGFNNDKYLKLQSEEIIKRIASFDNKLYLEFGGKLFDDFHAARVLPGFMPDSKIKMLLNIAEECEIMIVINANDIERNKLRGDLGITYHQELMRLIDAFKAVNLYVGSVVITHYAKQKAATLLKKKLEKLGIQTALHYPIANYPFDVETICSKNGFGKNEYIKTTKPLVVVTAPGPGSGKLACALSQIYNDYKYQGLKSGYAKFETFPIWNLALKHPVNLAYEAATADLLDVNMIDPFHLEAYNIKTVNYNRDVESFPILNNLLEKIYQVSPYKSPTDMGVNMAGYCIEDDQVCRESGNKEIIRRYFEALLRYRKEADNQDAINRLEALMSFENLNINQRKVYVEAEKKAKLINLPVACLELPNQKLIIGKSSVLLGACSACILNALKYLAGIEEGVDLISPDIIKPISELKVQTLGGNNPRLHVEEVLLALSIEAKDNLNVRKALAACELLRDCEMHSSVILSEIDVSTLKKLKIDLTQSPIYHSKKLYHKR